MRKGEGGRETNSQKMKKQSMSCEVTPAEAGRLLGNACRKG